MKDRADDGVEVHLIRLAQIRKAAEAVPNSPIECELDQDRRLEALRYGYKILTQE